MFQIADRQGLLKGDLNILQRTGLAWLMNREVENEVSIERARIESFALAANPATSPEFLKALFMRPPETEPVEEEDGQWVTPESAEEIEKMLSGL